MFSSHLLVLLLHCYLGAASGRTVKRTSRSTQDSGVLLRSPTDPFSGGLEQDMVSQHMFKLYEKYNKETRLREGNTVKGFRASQDTAEQRKVYQLNLTSLQDSEVILSASFHFLLDRRPRQKAWTCKRFKSPPCHPLPSHPSPSVSIRLHAVSPGSGISLGSPGSLLGNLTFHPNRREVWQMKDLTQVIKEAWDKGHVLLSLELDIGQQYRSQPAEAVSIGGSLPYLLLYANDQALAEPNSVASSLQRYDPFAEGREMSHFPDSSVLPHDPEIKGRVRREAGPLYDLVQSNDLPEDDDHRPEVYDKESQLESTWYLALKSKSTLVGKEKKKEQAGVSGERVQRVKEREEPQVTRGGENDPQLLPPENINLKKSGRRDGETTRGEGDERRHGGKDGRRHKGRSGGAQPQSPLLSFDERTMRKARRRQWGGAPHKGCSRNSLRVDFADIGWSEWVIAPKAFDAFYCAGTCGFPMPKVTRPSNHATIQSIVRAVGIIPGVPEPCCVPEKMSPLAVLYQDEARNPVLKVYPNMSVQSCACR